MFDYIRDPEDIMRASFAAVRAATDLSAVPADMEPVALRLVHASGMPDLVADLRFSPGAAAAGAQALRTGTAVLVDARMVAAGITADRLPSGNEVVCTVHAPEAQARAAAAGTTRSAAAVDLWRPRLKGAVVAIGNAPTALFRLLELLHQGADAPALIVGLPVGFIGAAEAKRALIEHAGAVPYITLTGRRGGSALAAAAVNALTENAG